MYYTLSSLTTCVRVVLTQFLMITPAVILDGKPSVSVLLTLSEHTAGTVNKSLLKEDTHISCSITVY
jgi:hypothetical protein